MDDNEDGRMMDKQWSPVINKGETAKYWKEHQKDYNEFLKNKDKETRVMGRVPKNRSLHSNPTVSQSLELAGVSSIDEYFDKWDD